MRGWAVSALELGCCFAFNLDLKVNDLMFWEEERVTHLCNFGEGGEEASAP